ncbi:solute carrier family 22 member 13-like isoform X1 [Mauremys reevesii]|uniref:solute carrier family 22 member 13-like isoform X1 n=2 Tax=Mauremys reevesii TaxID=260615 RepID=UPI00193FCC9A|nr:solute carrier family 22 member 13-like isoform X1 [Mauremys reevesii]
MTHFGDIINAIGDLGPFQKWLLLMLSLANFLTAFPMFGQVFMVLDVPHHCKTSWIYAISPNLTEEQLLNLTIPRNTQGSYEECLMYTPVNWDIDSVVEYGLNVTKKCQEGWVYSSEQIPTLVTQFDLVCDRKELNDISQSIYMLGLLLGAVISGSLSDRIGRRPIILLSMLVMGAFGVGAAFVPNFYVYVILRCLVGAAVSGIFIGILALGTEWVGVPYRSHAVIVTHCCFSIGQMVLAGLAYGIRNWRLLQIAGSAPVFCLFFYIWVLPESARWLMTKEKVKEAKNLLQKAASVNRRTISPELLDQLTPEKKVKSGNILDLFLKKCLRKVTLVMAYAWFVNSLVYYGLSLNVGSFGLDIYLTQLVFGAVEIPARFGCIFLLQWFGRKKCQGCFLLLGGAMCLIITCIPKDLPVVVTTLAVIGKFAIAASFSVSYVYAAELFPTIIRQTGVGLCSMSSRVGGIISPLISLLDKYHPAIPMVIFGSTPVTAGILCFLLPETRGKELQDHTEEAKESQWASENGHLTLKDGDRDVGHTRVTRV